MTKSPVSRTQVGGEGVDVATTRSRKKGSVNSSKWMSLIWAMRKPWKGWGGWRWRCVRMTSEFVAGELTGVERQAARRQARSR